MARCYKCHSVEGKIKGQLRLDTRAGWVKGGETGPAIVAGDPDHSLMIQAVRHTKQDLEMPPDSKLPEAEVATLVEWVKRGAPDPRTGPATPAIAARPTGNTEKARSHWAYQPIRAAAAPVVKETAWARGEKSRNSPCRAPMALHWRGSIATARCWRASTTPRGSGSESA